MVRLFREIMSACLAQQEPLKIGFLGPEGTFTQDGLQAFWSFCKSSPIWSQMRYFKKWKTMLLILVLSLLRTQQEDVNNTLDMFVRSVKDLW